MVGVPDLRDGVLFDAVAILRPDRQPGRYAKTHLFRTEKELFTPGSSLWTGEIADWQCGVLVCYEIAFPEVARALALSGARLLIVPAAFARPAAAGPPSSPATAAWSTRPATSWPTPATAPRC